MSANKKKRNEELERKEKSLGIGIYIVCIATFIYDIIGITLNIITLIIPDQLKAWYMTRNATAEQANEIVSPVRAIVIILFTALIAISVMLILLKKKIGVYGYFAAKLASIIAATILNGFQIWNILCALILPVVMYFLVVNKKHVFNFSRI